MPFDWSWLFYTGHIYAQNLTKTHIIYFQIKPKQELKFLFDIRNDSNKEDFLIVGIQLAHPQPQFVMSEHPYIFGEEPHVWDKSKYSSTQVNSLNINIEVNTYQPNN